MLAEYNKAYKKGKKDYQLRMMKGERPTLPVLDEMLPVKGTFKEVPLGIVKIPMNRLVGTKTNARSNAFASNFMPILSMKELEEVVIYTDMELDYFILMEKESIKSLCVNGEWLKKQ